MADAGVGATVLRPQGQGPEVELVGQVARGGHGGAVATHTAVRVPNPRGLVKKGFRLICIGPLKFSFAFVPVGFRFFFADFRFFPLPRKSPRRGPFGLIHSKKILVQEKTHAPLI